ncbi:MAG: tetratricopeptide repeat protein [Sedimentisphaerales bacterium]|nr:tetratricopeptide repeat protein [Sedimentisphaerales bacterium]
MSEDNSKAAAKARAFFEKARSVAGTGNFDYAIDMYMQGLRYAPDALMEGHLPLCELGLQRREKGGKKSSMMDKVMRLRGKTPLEQMLNAEYLFVKNPNHLPYAEAMLKAALAGGYKKTAGWIANLVFQMANDSEKPSANTYILLKDAYCTLEQFDKAIAACQRASKLRPGDKALSDEYKDLSAELTMVRGKYDGEGDFRKSIKDRESQEKLHGQAGVVKTEDYRIKAVEDARKKIAQNPDLPSNIFELADALSDLESEDAENNAIQLLENAYRDKSDFSFQRRAGLLKIKQLRRKIKEAEATLESNPNDAPSKAASEKLTAELDALELEHYRLCVKNYPTDLAAKYDYAIRLLKNKQYNEAIPLFQEAQRDPRRKISAMNHVGVCFFEKGWLDDAIDVFTRAMNAYELKEDTTAKELRYNLARAYEEQGESQKALDVYRKIAQIDFSYKDVSQRVDELRAKQKKG